ncbi:MAG: ATP:cob(I)alamin adenosyltransferase [Sphingopyxis sp.]|nr:ATP:cob(I)alamin adenosyltransferase [Sphingopyxis sp.]
MVKLNKIYTRTGDDGTTGLVDGSRVAKSAALMAAIGDVDEANSLIGFAIRALDDTDMAAQLTRIQNDLFDLGADLATPAVEGDAPFAPGEMALRVIASQVSRLEDEIDAMNADMAPLTSFILPAAPPKDKTPILPNTRLTSSAGVSTRPDSSRCWPCMLPASAAAAPTGRMLNSRRPTMHGKLPPMQIFPPAAHDSVMTRALLALPLIART